ncbi:unnamed protein product, partial [Ectocarpus sp. 8 AP-2014]
MGRHIGSILDARKRFKLLGELPNVEFGHSFSTSPFEGLKPIPDGTCRSSPYSPLYARSTAATPNNNSPRVFATGDVSHIYFLRRFCLQDGNEVGQNTQQEQSCLQKPPQAVLFCLMRFEYNETPTPTCTTSPESVHHMGKTTSTGHYVVVVRLAGQGWRRYDDDKSHRIRAETCADQGR